MHPLCHIADLALICREKGIQYVVFSPGSRNAPLVQVFHKIDGFEITVIPDERSAGFFAMGIAQQTQQPVAVICTSGSALMNYAPAVTEALYQQIPLVVISADRPVELIDQGEGQSIRQEGALRPHVLADFSLPRKITDEKERRYVQRNIHRVLNASNQKPAGPVHLNVHLDEPLYDNIPLSDSVPTIHLQGNEHHLSDQEKETIRTDWESRKNILVLVGMHPYGKDLSPALERMSANPSIAILTESTSNTFGPTFNPCIDRMIDSLPEDNERFRPDLIVTIGHSIISKKIKALLRTWKSDHWHIGPEEQDTFFSLSRCLKADPRSILTWLSGLSSQPSDFGRTWKQQDLQTQQAHFEYLQQAPFSDLKVFQLLNDLIPDYANLQMGNSSVVRYFQLFDPVNSLLYNANRGVSGIDGSLSTAVGAAFVNGKEDVSTYCILGDLSFIYDSNGLWNNHLDPNLRIIVINNQGGGIFRIIPGPKDSGHLEEHFDAHVPVNIKALCETYNLHHSLVDSEESILDTFPEFAAPSDRPKVLEIVTAKAQNDIVLMDYFKHIKQHIHEQNT